jgi:UDP-3-O-[3-hydroxymyristoyl] N-acetylglucosamine deacetylase
LASTTCTSTSPALSFRSWTAARPRSYSSLQSAGVEEQAGHKRYLRVTSPVEVHDGDKWARFTPFDGFRLDFTIDFPHPLFGSENRNVVVDFASDSYAKEVARARTFGFMQDVEAMRAAGLGLGGSLQNAVVLDEFKVLNSEGLRYDDEFVRHKVLDAIGDLYLLGNPLIGQYTAYKSGHALNNKLCRALLARADAWQIATFTDEKTVPAAFHGWAQQPA